MKMEGRKVKEENYNDGNDRFSHIVVGEWTKESVRDLQGEKKLLINFGIKMGEMFSKRWAWEIHLLVRGMDRKYYEHTYKDGKKNDGLEILG
jgi:hypothetical protein